MSDKPYMMNNLNIKVPDGMLKAAQDAWSNVVEYEPNPTMANLAKLRIPVVLEAALRWQRENMSSISDAEFGEMVKICGKANEDAWDGLKEWDRSIILCDFRVRFMYDAPDTAHPVLKKWLEDCEAKGVDEATKVNYRRLFNRAFEAGQKAGLK